MNKPIDHETRQYIRTVNAIARLSTEQELALAHAYKARGDRAAADTLIRANLRHVIPMALRYARDGRPLGDLIAQGNLALMTALDRFEPERGLRFVTYAKHAIRAEMLGHVLRHRSLVGGGRGYQRGLYVFRLQREHAHLQSKLGETEGVYTELAARFGRSSTELSEIVSRLQWRDSSLDASPGESSTTLGDMLPADEAPHDEQLARDGLQADLSAEVGGALTELDARERFIVQHRLMADPEERYSLRDVGEHFGVSRERARQLEARVKDKLRRRLRPLATRWELNATAA